MTKEYTAEENAAWRAAQPKKQIGVKAIIKSRDGKVLLLKPNYKRTWQMPGGGVDANESPEAGLTREVYEETGIKIYEDDLILKGLAYRQDHDTMVLIYEYSGAIDADQKITMQNEEIEDVGFFEIGELIHKLPDYYQRFLNNYSK